MPKDLTSIRYGRLLDIMKLLESASQVTHSDIFSAGEYSSNRTLQNDLRYLRETWEAEIRYDPKKKVYILDHPGSFIINLKITRREAEALTSGLKTTAHFLPHLEEAAKSLWKKLDAYIPRGISSEGANLARMTTIAVPAAKVNAEIFDSLLDAMRHNRAVNIRYKSPGKTARSWVISPYSLYFRGSSWYLAGCCHAFGSLAVYRAGRIQSVRPADNEAYISPEEAGYSEEYISSAWYVTPGKAKHRIRVYVSEYLAESLSEIELHPTQRTELCEDGGVILTAEVPSLEEAARWVMASAPGVKVIEPEELRNLVREYCTEVMAAL